MSEQELVSEAVVSTNRRGFLSRVSGWVLGGAAMLGITGCDRAAAALSGSELEDDHDMHGPVQAAEWALKLPEAESAIELFAPYHQGEPFLRRWAVGRVARGKRDQLVVVVVDTETGGHAELEIFAHDRAIKPVANSERYALTVNNGGRGDKKTPLHMRRLSQRLAEVMADNEHYVDLSWRLPTLLEADAKDRMDADDGVDAVVDPLTAPLELLLGQE